MLRILSAHIRLVLNEIIYWAVGSTPEEHHANAAFYRHQLGHHRKCIEQCNKYLTYSQSDQVKTMLGHSHAAIGNWGEAALAYRSISKLSSQPLVALGLAAAELRSGNESEARKIVATIEVTHPQPTYALALAIEQLNGELQKPGSVAEGN